MAHPERNRRTANETLQNVLDTGRHILDLQPDFLEQYSHHSGRWLKNVDLAKSHGIHIHTKDGVFLDFTNHWNSGMLDRLKHTELNDPRYLELLGILMQEKATPTETEAGVEAAFVDMMQDFFARGNEEMKKFYTVLPVCAGTLAVDDSIHTAKSLVAEHRGVKPQSLKGVAFEAAYHGRHGDAAEATTNLAKVGHKQHGFVTHITAPAVEYMESGLVNWQVTQKNLDESMAKTEKYLSSPEYAYVITEYPIQAEGGAFRLHNETLQQLHNICLKYNKLLIVDAVQMGGRTWYEDPQTGFVSPFSKDIIEYADIISFGKVFHANGSVINLRRVNEKGLNPNYILEHPQEWGGTFTSTFADMLSGSMIMNIILNKQLWKNALIKTREIEEHLNDMYSKLLPISHIRGRSDIAYLAWDLPDKHMRNEFLRLLRLNERIILLPAGEKSIRLAPSPDMTTREMNRLVTGIENQLLAMKTELHL